MATTFPSGTYGDMIVKTSGINHYMRLSDSSGASDSYGSLSGTSSGCTFKRPGALAGDQDTSTYFDGVNDYITYGDFFRLLGSFTFEIWIKPTRSGAATFLSKENYDAPISGWSWYLDTNMVPTFTRLHDTRSTTKGIAIGVNTWTHLVVTYDGYTVRQYQNGVLRWEQPDSVSSYSSAYHCVMGCQSDYNPVAYADWFQGYLDEFAVYNKALSGLTIKNHYDRGRIPPVQYYHLYDSDRFTASESRAVVGSPKLSDLRTIGRNESVSLISQTNISVTETLGNGTEDISINTAFGGPILTSYDTSTLSESHAFSATSIMQVTDETFTGVVADEHRIDLSFHAFSENAKMGSFERGQFWSVVRASIVYSSVLRKQSGFVHYAVSKKVKGKFTITYDFVDVIPPEEDTTMLFFVVNELDITIAIGSVRTRWTNSELGFPILVDVSTDLENYTYTVGGTRLREFILGQDILDAKKIIVTLDEERQVRG